ncbi:hypothetical protein ACFXTH_047439 [Malus domestica]
MSVYLQQLKEISNSLFAVEAPISDRDLMAATLAGLPDEFESFIDSLMLRLSSTSLDELHGFLFTKEPLCLIARRSHPILNRFRCSMCSHKHLCFPLHYLKHLPLRINIHNQILLDFTLIMEEATIEDINLTTTIVSITIVVLGAIFVEILQMEVKIKGFVVVISLEILSSVKFVAQSVMKPLIASIV